MAWGDVVGQDTAKHLLRAHLETGRPASAWLLAGPEGVGKRRLAREFAKTLMCQGAGAERPCADCPSCAQVGRGLHPDLHVIEPEEESGAIKIGTVRMLLGRIALRPFNASVQVVVLEEADRLLEEAGNALLKSLEEPSARTRFVLTTSRLSYCLPTLVSRCQVVRCERLTTEAVQAILESDGHEPRIAEAAARLAAGSAGRAGRLARRWAEHEQILARLSVPSLGAWTQGPALEGRADVLEVLEALITWLRDLAVVALAEAGPVQYADRRAALRQQARRVDPDRCLETAFELLALREALEQAGNPRLIAAMARERWLSLFDP